MKETIKQTPISSGAGTSRCWPVRHTACGNAAQLKATALQPITKLSGTERYAVSLCLVQCNVRPRRVEQPNRWSNVHTLNCTRAVFCARGFHKIVQQNHLTPKLFLTSESNFKPCTVPAPAHDICPKLTIGLWHKLATRGCMRTTGSLIRGGCCHLGCLLNDRLTSRKFCATDAVEPPGLKGTCIWGPVENRTIGLEPSEPRYMPLSPSSPQEAVNCRGISLAARPWECATACVILGRAWQGYVFFKPALMMRQVGGSVLGTMRGLSGSDYQF